MGEFEHLRTFLLVIGNARSGSTLLGSILDAHANAVVANETTGSSNYWRDMDRGQILREIADNSRRNRESGRVSEGYRYLINPDEKEMSKLNVIGDKVWNPATLLMHGDHALLPRLEALLGVPIKIIHAIRNPFDVIATMHARSQAPISDRTAWYFMHCDAARAVRDRWDDSRYLDFHHESLFDAPAESISALCDFAGLAPDQRHIEACRQMLFTQPKQTRCNLKWEAGAVRRILGKIGEYDFLTPYALEDYSSLTASGDSQKQ